MGIFDFIFGADKSCTNNTDETYEHESLGEMYMDTDSSWFVEDVVVPISSDPISVSLEGKQPGPDDGALLGLDWLTQNWEAVRRESGIEAHLFDLYQNYVSDEEPSIRLNSPSDIWGTAKMLSLCLKSKSEFSITWTFEWQHPEDDHIITVYVEDGLAKGSSMDG